MARLIHWFPNYHWRTCETCGGENLYGHYNDHSGKWLECANCFIQKNEEKLSKEEWRRFNYLLSLYDYLPKEMVKQQVNDKNYLWRGKELKNAIEIYTFSDKLGFNEELIFSYWYIIRSLKKDRHEEYKKKPRRVRKDNKGTINRGGGHDNNNTIRKPKKVRKTAWKRFHKLFPHLDPKNKNV